ncbi:MAG: bifunctional diguanylate cyclase/phosphohydrolase [Bacillota bacterium]
MRLKLPLWYILLFIVALFMLLGSTIWLDMQYVFEGRNLVLVLLGVFSGGFILLSLSLAVGYNMMTSNKNDGKQLEFFINENKDFFDQMNQAMVIQKLVRDESGKIKDIRILNANYRYESLMELNLEQVRNKTLTDIFNVKTPPYFDYYKKLDRTGITQTFTSYFPLHKKYYHITMVNLEKDKLAVVFLDVSNDQSLTSQLSTMSYNDSLTGLYNFRYYNEIIQKYSQPGYLPLSIIVVDLNALKLFNDAFGHEYGNELIKEAADFLSKTFGFLGKVMRTGGDEFVILLPNMSQDTALNKMATAKQKSASVKVGNIGVSMSFGLTTMSDRKESYDYHFRVAENKMYHYKLRDGIYLRTQLLKQIETMLYENVPFEKGHSRRVVALSKYFAKDLDLPENLFSLLKDAAQYHDIGKVAVEKSLLNSAKKLDDIDTIKIKSHVEVGYRLLSSIPDMGAIADVVLSHHENVDGTGYPRRIRKEQIPLLSRMLRIVEAYDVLTHKTPYSSVLTKDKAAKEMWAFAGSHFDRDLLKVFLKKTIKAKV